MPLIGVEEPSTVIFSMMYPALGVMVYVWLPPETTSIVPRGEIVPFSPVVEVIGNVMTPVGAKVASTV